MTAKETQSDWTTASGTKDFSIFQPDRGWQIESVVGPLEVAHRYRDGNYDKDSFGPGGPVTRLDYVGDTSGDEAGERTRVDVTFNRLQVVVVQNANCVPDTAVRGAWDLGLVHPNSFRRLEFSMSREREARALRLKSEQ